MEPSDATTTALPDQRTAQENYHRRLFAALHDWERAEERILDFTAGSGPADLLGLDQMGHFGPTGCDLVADRVRAYRPGPAIRLCELGSGFGGALRYLVDNLNAAGPTAGSRSAAAAPVPVPVAVAVGVELVPEHCAVSSRISRSQGRASLIELCASAEDVPLAGSGWDVVVITGSMPHFPRPGAVLREARRLLRPGGLLVATEEVSLAAADAQVSARFRRYHPPGVFFVTPLPERREQLAAAGFDRVLVEERREWGLELLGARLKAVQLFRGTAEGILGTTEVVRIVETLEAAREEYRSGRLIPAVITAQAPAD
jgi:SAM-dependent methyltransferase